MKPKQYVNQVQYAEAVSEMENPRLQKKMNERQALRSTLESEIAKLPTLREVADGYILTVARLCDTKSRCAKVLGVTHVTLSKRLKQMGVANFPASRRK